MIELNDTADSLKFVVMEHRLVQAVDVYLRAESRYRDALQRKGSIEEARRLHERNLSAARSSVAVNYSAMVRPIPGSTRADIRNGVRAYLAAAAKLEAIEKEPEPVAATQEEVDSLREESDKALKEVRKLTGMEIAESNG